MFFGYQFLVFLVMMSSNSGPSAPVPNQRLPLSLFIVRKPILKYDDYIYSCRFASKPIDVQHCLLYGSRYGDNHATAAVGWTNRWAQWRGRCAALRTDSVTVPLCMPFIRCIEERRRIGSGYT